MRKANKEYMIEEIVFRIFLKHVKAKNLYLAFRWSVNHPRSRYDMVHAISSYSCYEAYQKSLNRLSEIGCAFLGVSSIDDILRTMRNLNGSQKPLKVENNNKFQMAIMNMVNNLLHSCIEHAITKDFKVLEEIGSTVFEESCKALLGDSFVDKTEESIDPHQREFMKKMRMMYEIGGRMPRLSETLNWEGIDKMLRDQAHAERARAILERGHATELSNNPWHENFDNSVYDYDDPW